MWLKRGYILVCLAIVDAMLQRCHWTRQCAPRWGQNSVLRTASKHISCKLHVRPLSVTKFIIKWVPSFFVGSCRFLQVSVHQIFAKLVLATMWDQRHFIYNTKCFFNCNRHTVISVLFKWVTYVYRRGYLWSISVSKSTWTIATNESITSSLGMVLQKNIVVQYQQAARFPFQSESQSNPSRGSMYWIQWHFLYIYKYQVNNAKSI